MNWRRSSSSGVWRLELEPAEYWSRQSWSSWRIRWSSWSKGSAGLSLGFSVAGSYWVSAGGSAGSAWAEASSPADLAFLGGFLGDGGFLEDGVLLEFLLHQRLEFEHGCLQQRQRLLELRRQHHLLRHALGEMESLRYWLGVTVC